MADFEAILVNTLPGTYPTFKFTHLVRRHALELYDPAYGVQIWQFEDGFEDANSFKIWGDWPIRTRSDGSELSVELRRRATALLRQDQKYLSIFCVIPETSLQQIHDGGPGAHEHLVKVCAAILETFDNRMGPGEGLNAVSGRVAVYLVVPQSLPGTSRGALGRLATDVVRIMNRKIEDLIPRRRNTNLVRRCLFLSDEFHRERELQSEIDRFRTLRTVVDALVSPLSGSSDRSLTFQALRGEGGRPALISLQAPYAHASAFSLSDPMRVALRDEVCFARSVGGLTSQVSSTADDTEKLEEQYQELKTLAERPTDKISPADEIENMVEQYNRDQVSGSKEIPREYLPRPDRSLQRVRRADKTKDDKQPRTSLEQLKRFGSKWVRSWQTFLWRQPDLPDELDDLDQTFRANAGRLIEILFQLQKSTRRGIRQDQLQGHQRIRDILDRLSESNNLDVDEKLETYHSNIFDYRFRDHDNLAKRAAQARDDLVQRFDTRKSSPRDLKSVSRGDLSSLATTQAYIEASDELDGAVANLTDRRSGIFAIGLSCFPGVLYAFLVLFTQNQEVTAVFGQTVLIFLLALLGVATLSLFLITFLLTRRFKQRFRTLRLSAQDMISEVSEIPARVREYSAAADSNAGFRMIENEYRMRLDAKTRPLQERACAELGDASRSAAPVRDDEFDRVKEAVRGAATSRFAFERIVEVLVKSRGFRVENGALTVTFQGELGKPMTLPSSSIYAAHILVSWPS